MKCAMPYRTGYFMVDHAIVWRTIQVDLPPLRRTVEALLASLEP